MTDTRSHVLVVDDDPVNLHLLVHFMQMEGYAVDSARTGAAALAWLQDFRPDMILLDINIPEMDGFEICQRLKADARNRDIPVVFLSGLHDTFDKVKAFEMGGVDYITKPFQMDEVRVRIETHLRMAKMKAALEQANAKLREEEKQREMLIHLIVHDMRTPLFGIVGMADLVSLNPDVQRDSETRDYVTIVQESARSLVNLISDMLDVYKQDCGSILVHPDDAVFSDMVTESTRLLGGLSRRRHFDVHQPEVVVRVRCDKGLTIRVLVNLLANAFRFTREGTRVTLSAVVEEPFLKVRVEDEGEGISSADQDRLFSKFGQLESKQKGVRYSTGLGLVFCRMVVEAQGGSIGVVSAPGNGSTFWLTLPLAPAVQ